MRVVFLLLVLALPGEVVGESAAKRWTLSGWLLAEGSHAPGATHTPIAGQEVVLRRFSRPIWCVLCIGGYVDSATSTTDDKGRFQFSGRKSGWYQVVVRCPRENPLAFAAERDLGIRRGEYTTYLEYSTAFCK
jgi:hypothetical protein